MSKVRGKDLCAISDGRKKRGGRRYYIFAKGERSENSTPTRERDLIGKYSKRGRERHSSSLSIGGKK